MAKARQEATSTATPSPAEVAADDESDDHGQDETGKDHAGLRSSVWKWSVGQATG